ncbi:LysR family transcriptional regulator [Alkalihalobacillus oceani]|uniref:LysR family transcriptional regulator n=1 Tax=Halalkalibacter oceani TaxID=1653776 RepID=UPI00203CA15E|nr:LysR substrate-binding domain-containing protein [Halalkalibacter oceani]MCM3762220.1 LysR family transcriptional regulator [Halalkalibacter oceani]
MDIKDLLIFKTLAAEKNITKTAERLNYVQSNVTARMKKLEAELNTQLFYRHPRGISLTGKGKLLVKQAEEILLLVNETKKAIQDSDEPHGSLSLGTNETAAAARLPQLLVNYNGKFPNVELSLRVALTTQLVQDVLEHKLDGAFVIGPIEDSQLEAIPIYQEELVIITNPKQDIKLSAKNILTRPNCPYKTRLDRWLESNQMSPGNRLELSTLEAILHCVEAGLGMAILPKALASQQINEGALTIHTLSPDEQTVDLFFIHRKDIYLDQAYRAFLRLLKEEEHSH